MPLTMRPFRTRRQLPEVIVAVGIYAVTQSTKELIRGGRTPEAKELQLQQASPLADRLERLTNQLVNKAEADVVAGIEVSGVRHG
jgi:hypothetical protein